MTIKEIISGLVDLKIDAESHREKDGTIDDVFQHDIDVLDAAIKIVTECEREYTTLEKCWYQYFTGKQAKRKHLVMKLVCTECRCVWDTQGYAFKYCPNCGREVLQED